VKILPTPEATTLTPGQRRAVGSGIAWDPDWVNPRRLRIRGYRAANASTAITLWEFDSLVAMTDRILVDAGWTVFERHAVRLVLGRLYERDLTGIDPHDALTPGAPPAWTSSSCRNDGQPVNR